MYLEMNVHGCGLIPLSYALVLFIIENETGNEGMNLSTEEVPFFSKTFGIEKI